MIRNTSGKTSPVVWLLIAVVAFALFSGSGTDFFNADKDEGPTVIQTIQSPGVGTSATLNLNTYDTAGDTRSLVGPQLWLVDQDGIVLVNGVSTNTTTAVNIGDVVTVYGADNDGSAYYVDPLEVDVSGATQTVDVTAYAMPTQSNMNITAYDSDWSALTYDGNTNNSALQTYAFGADESKVVNYKITLGQANVNYRLGAICTFANNDARKIELVDTADSSWETTSVPEDLVTRDLTLYGDTGEATAYTVSMTRCWKPSGEAYSNMNEWDEVRVKSEVTAGTTDPATNTGDFVGFAIFDYSYELDSNNAIVGDFYRHDDNGRASEVGLNETEYYQAFKTNASNSNVDGATFHILEML